MVFYYLANYNESSILLTLPSLSFQTAAATSERKFLLHTKRLPLTVASSVLSSWVLADISPRERKKDQVAVSFLTFIFFFPLAVLWK